NRPLGSPAMNAGNCNNGAVTTSQNGTRRPTTYLPFCDIGAYELAREGTVELTLGQNFRTTDLTDYGVAITQIPDIHDTYLTYDNGSLFYRGCANFNQLTTSLTSTLTTLQPDYGPTCPLTSTIYISPFDVYNTLRHAHLDAWEEAYQDETPGTSPASLNAIIETITAQREQNYMFVLYGNEFYADAVRFNLYNQLLDGEEIIANEIEQMEYAYAQFQLVTLNMARAANRPLPPTTVPNYNGPPILRTTVSDYYTDGDADGFIPPPGNDTDTDDLELFAIATRRQAEVAADIAQRYRLLGQFDTAINRLETEYDKQQKNAALFYLWAQPNPNPAAVMNANFGPEMSQAIERLDLMATEFRSSNNPLGYRNLYVPRIAYVDMRNRTLGAANLPLEQAEASELAARNAQLDYEDSTAIMDLELDNLESEYVDQLIELCGTNDFSAAALSCDGGAMGASFSTVVAAAKNVDLATQRIQNISQLIAIEEERAGQTISITLGAANDISLAQLQIGKLNATQTINTTFTSDTQSARESLTTAVTAGYKVSIETEASTNPFNNSASVKSEAYVETSVTAAVEIAAEQTRGSTEEKVSNPNLEAIAQYESRQLLRQAEADAAIIGADSAATIRQLLLDQSDALIERDIAQAEFNAVFIDHNTLILQYQTLLSAHIDDTDAYQDYFNKPAYRLIYDSTSSQFAVDFEFLLHSAYLTAKALEYELLDPSLIPYNDLYTARTTQEVRTFLEGLDTLHGQIVYNGDSTVYNYSLAEDFLGLTDPYLLTLLPFTVDPLANNWPTRAECAGPFTTAPQIPTLRGCLFQEFLNTETQTDNDIQFGFNTPLEQFYDGSVWNIRIDPLVGDDSANCTTSPLCSGGVSLNILTNQTYSDGPPRIRLIHDGLSSYIRQTGGQGSPLTTTQYAPAAPHFVGDATPAGFPTGARVTVPMNAAVNGVGGNSTDGFTLLSAVTTGWELRFNKNSIFNTDLDFDQITDIEVNLHTRSRGVQEFHLNNLQAQINSFKQDGKTIPLTLQTEYDQHKATLLAQALSLSPSDEAKLTTIVDAMRQQSAPQNLLDPNVINGLYRGSMLTFGFADLGLFINATTNTGSQPITATLCITCSALNNIPATLTGNFVATGTPTDTFALTSGPFPETIDNQTFTTYITITGDVINHGNTISGTYQELSITPTGQQFTLVGDFIASRPLRTPGSTSAPLAITLPTPTPITDANLAWSATDTNCGYQLYRSATPYFVRNPRLLLTSIFDDLTTTTNDPNATGAPDLNRFYRLRTLSCGANLNILEPNASYYQDSNEVGLFTFTLVNGN
ncbi:MAG TPA: choice-of-anchor Q domain-containing protein, partial [Anaerolineae bacterium]|nr:choice-of-anchor Q domain-containing protein [Anaerolineae bacterium]